MAKRWTQKEDEFLLEYAREPKFAGFIASHDFGRSEASGKRRYLQLTKSGARASFAEKRIAEIKFSAARGTVFEDEFGILEEWESELILARGLIDQLEN